MPREYPDGVCTLDMIDNEFQYLVPITEYERLHNDWLNGSMFASWTGHLGQRVTVKCARIEMITKYSAEAWSMLEDARRERAITGGE